MKRIVLALTLFALALPALPALGLSPDGKPEGMDTGSTYRYMVWRDGDQWHVRWTTAGAVHRFIGKIHSEKGVFSDAKPSAIEKGDWIKIGPKGHNIAWDTKAAGGADGVDFKLSAKGATFDLLIDGKRHPKRVFVGKAGENPLRIPFTIEE